LWQDEPRKPIVQLPRYLPAQEQPTPHPLPQEESYGDFLPPPETITKRSSAESDMT
jgi:hypothetical protein